MYNFEYDQLTDTYMWGTFGDGIGLFNDVGNLFEANIVVNGNIHFMPCEEGFEEAKIKAIQEYERLKKELE